MKPLPPHSSRVIDRWSKSVKWVPYAEVKPLPDDTVMLFSDGYGGAPTMRIPCSAFDAIALTLPEDRIFYRLRNRPKLGDVVKLYPSFTVSANIFIREGEVFFSNGSIFMVKVEVFEEDTVTILGIERYENEIVVLRDEQFNEAHGREHPWYKQITD